MGQPIKPKNFFTTHADRQFVFDNMIDWETLLEAWDGDADMHNKETYEMILKDSAGPIAGEKIAPRSPIMDREHYSIDRSVLQTGELVWPQSVRDSYNDLKEVGMNGGAISEEYGGFGCKLIWQRRVAIN